MLMASGTRHIDSTCQTSKYSIVNHKHQHKHYHHKHYHHKHFSCLKSWVSKLEKADREGQQLPELRDHGAKPGDQGERTS